MNTDDTLKELAYDTALKCYGHTDDDADVIFSALRQVRDAAAKDTEVELLREALTDISKLSDDRMIANIARNALEGK